jgi:hypothetical protein
MTEPYNKHYPEFAQGVVDETVRAQFLRGNYGKLIEIAKQIIQEAHDDIFGLRNGMSIDNASKEALIDYCELYNIPDYGLDLSWMRVFIRFKRKTRYYGGKLYGTTGFIQLCKFLTNAEVVEDVQTGPRGHVVFCYVNFDITETHLSAWRYLLTDLKLINRSLCVFVMKSDNFARDEERFGVVPIGSKEEGVACYQILA